MKSPVYIATILLATLGFAWAAPPSKIHNPNYKQVRAEKQADLANRSERMRRMQRMHRMQPTEQRASTVALNVREKRNQFKTHGHRNKGH